MKQHLIQIVMGTGTNPETQWIENFFSTVIPCIGETIVTKKAGRNIVKDIIKDYRQIQYENKKDRGAEVIFVFI